MKRAASDMLAQVRRGGVGWGGEQQKGLAGWLAGSCARLAEWLIAWLVGGKL